MWKRKAFDRARTIQVSTISAAIMVAAAVLGLGIPGVPSLAAVVAECHAGAETLCCACYTDEDGTFQCHGGAHVGATDCNSGTGTCSRIYCRSPSRE